MIAPRGYLKNIRIALHELFERKNCYARLLGIEQTCHRQARRLPSEAFLAFPKLRECNICGWRGRRFLSDEWHPFTICPGCRLQVRHRLLMAALAGMTEVSFAQVVDGKTVLHCAPEAVLKGVLRGRAGVYLTADFPRTDVGRQLDLSDLSVLAADTFDLLMACDVLEHVPEDHRAMREIHRVLRRGGLCDCDCSAAGRSG